MTGPVDANDTGAVPIAPIESDESVGFDGGEVKALGGGKVGGYLVRFGTPETADVQGDYFDASTYFGRSKELDILYDHGMPMRRGDPWYPKFKNRLIGSGEAKSLGDGLWFDGQLDLSVPHVADLYRDIEAGRIGWSSGSVQRLVEAQSVKSRVGRMVRRIVRWPLVEATLSLKPVDPNNRAYALKALPDDEIADGPDGAASARGSIDDDLLRLATDAERLCALTAEFAALRRDRDGRDLSQHRLDSIKAVADAFADLHREYGAAAAAADPEAGAAEDLSSLGLELDLIGAYLAIHKQ